LLKSTLKKINILVLVKICFLVSCDHNQQLGVNYAVSEIITETPSVETIDMPPPSTATFTAPTVTQIPTTTLGPTVTFVPDIPLENNEEIFLEFIKNSGSCELPCIWGVTPGETTLEYVNENLLPLGKRTDFYDEVNGKRAFIIHIDYYNNESNVDRMLTIVTNGHLISEVATETRYLHPGDDSHWSHPLSNFNEPESMWIYGSGLPDGPVHYELILYYQRMGFYLSIEGEAQRIEDDGILLCPNPSGDSYKHSHILSWVVGEEEESYFLRYKELTEIFTNFEEMRTSMTIEMFYQTYILNDGNSCFELFPPEEDLTW
jgi:hypothetical protein